MHMILVGVPSNPIPKDTKVTADLKILKDMPDGMRDGFDATGIVTNGTITGTWICDPVYGQGDCTGMRGMFSGTKQ